MYFGSLSLLPCSLSSFSPLKKERLNQITARSWWLKPVILATQEEEIRRIVV
jgi:hypothetical protein